MGCGCVFLDDADRNDCGCDGPCCTEEWDVDTEFLWRPELGERVRDIETLLAAVRERDNTIASVRAELASFEKDWIPGRPNTVAAYLLIADLRAALDPQETP